MCRAETEVCFFTTVVLDLTTVGGAKEQQIAKIYIYTCLPLVTSTAFRYFTQRTAELVFTFNSDDFIPFVHVEHL